MNASQTGYLMAAAFASLGVVGSAAAAPTVIEDFTVNGGENDGAPSFGSFTFGAGPDGSGSNVGASAGTTGVAAADTFDFSPNTSHFNHLTITDDGFLNPNGSLFFGEDAAWNFRHVSNGGSPSTLNLVSQNGGTGWLGFYVRTEDENLVVAPALDENLDTSGSPDDTEVGSRKSIINDGQFHLYQWNLGDDDQWDAFFDSDEAANGELDGVLYTLDSINFWKAGEETGEQSAFDLAYLSYNADGPLTSLVPVPEPASIALLGLGMLGFAGRRRR